MDRNIQIEIRDRVAHLIGKPKIICGNSDYTVTFAFDDEWTGVDVKTLRVSYNNKHSDYVFTGDTVELPPIVKAIEVHLGVFAGGITSTKVAVRAEPSILCEGGSVVDPKPDIYAQLVDLINTLSCYGTENAGMLLYIGDDGVAKPLALGSGLELVNGVLSVTGGSVVSVTVGEDGDMIIEGVTLTVDELGNAIIDSEKLTVDENGNATIA